MKAIKTIVAIALFGSLATMNAQDAKLKSETRINGSQDKMAYYESRGAEDARFELEFKAKSKAEEKAFWKEQQEYEKNLKKENKKAYRAYIASKQEAYTEHHHHCDDHCYHSDSFYHHAGYYYYGYEEYNYHASPRSSSVHTQVRVNTPSVRLGIF